MSRINNMIKLSVLKINTVSFLFAVALIGIAVYVLASKWGNLDSAFFIGWGVILILFAVAVSMISIL